jgi:hypothetical protein
LLNVSREEARGVKMSQIYLVTTKSNHHFISNGRRKEFTLDSKLRNSMNHLIEVVASFNLTWLRKVDLRITELNQIRCQDHHAMCKPIVRLDQKTSFVF